jgi:phage FluMu protein Com
VIHTGKCPKCDEVMPTIKIQGVTAKELFGASWNAISYQCPKCDTVLSVEMDPVALKSDIVNEVAKRLGR